MANHYLIYCAYALLLQSFMVSSSTNVSDQISLLAFKSLITLDPGDILANNWTTETSFCNWIGVTCSLRRERVTGLNLFNMSLQGTISPSIGNLSFLIFLDLSDNNFHGNIPTDIGNLWRLREIFIPNNQLEGRIPLSLFNCKGLQQLSLAKNMLSGNLPKQLTQLSELQTISLSFNSFTGSIPEAIGNLTNLKELYLGRNNLTGSIPPSLGNISTLEVIGCRENNIEGDIPHGVGNLVHLTQLDFDYNRLTGVIPSMIFNISSLKYIAFTSSRLSGTIPTDTGLSLPKLVGLFLADNQLSGSFPISISNASILTELELSSNLFTGEIPNNLGNLRQLEFLNLQYNLLQNEPLSSELTFFNSLVECRNLEFLILGDNTLNGVLPSSVGNLTSSIQMFNMENAQLKGSIPVGIGNLSDMITLVLNNNELTGTIPSTIGQLKKLQRLYLMNNRLQGSIPEELCYLNQLGEMRLGEGDISGSIPNCIGNLSRLSIITLASNKLTSIIPSSFWTLQNLLSVNLSHNSLEKHLPTEIENLKTAEEIDLSWNEMSGSIPNTIGDLMTLRVLILSHNQFQGSIPLSFGNLIGLELMDVSSNSLSGTIPSYFQNLLHLQIFNVSFNQLRGEIPNRGVFTNLTAESFMGNEGLCGTSKLQVPRCVTITPQSKTRVKMIVLKYILPAAASALALLSFLTWLIRRLYRDSKIQVTPPSDLQTVEMHRMIPYQELRNATNSFSESNLLGKGSFSSVYKALLSDGTITAVKVLDLQHEGALKSFDVECHVINSIKHRNLIKIISICSFQEFRALILQYMPNGSLETWLHSHSYYLDLSQRIQVMLDVAMALNYLHNDYFEPVVHCDLKPSNILLDEDMVAHVGDFGIAKILAENNCSTQTKTLGTIGYIAPEYGSEGRVSTSCDVYSYGIVLMETFTRKRPTDDMFTEDWSLRQWVSALYPQKIMEAVDTNLLTNEGKWAGKMQDCLTSVIQLALDCSQNLPGERINMNEVVTRLRKIQNEVTNN